MKGARAGSTISQLSPHHCSSGQPCWDIFLVIPASSSWLHGELGLLALCRPGCSRGGPTEQCQARQDQPKSECWQGCHGYCDSQPRELRALQGTAKPFLGCSAQPMQTAKLLAWTWTGAGKSHSLHLKFYCEIRLCLDMQGLAQAEVCIL